MQEKNQIRCENCHLKKSCQDSKVANIFFVIGVVATVAMRVIEPLRLIDPFYAKLAWYIGVTGFFLFFIYKYKQSRDRAKVIEEHSLRQKINSDEPLKIEDRQILNQLICSNDNQRERINFFIIFALSLAALIVALAAELT